MERDSTFLGSYLNHKDYLDSAVYEDHKTELTAWLHDVYKRIIVEQDHDEVMRFQGRAQAIMEMLEMPDRIVQAMEMERE